MPGNIFPAGGEGASMDSNSPAAEAVAGQQSLSSREVNLPAVSDLGQMATPLDCNSGPTKVTRGLASRPANIMRSWGRVHYTRLDRY
jgi:hypothetical protein